MEGLTKQYLPKTDDSASVHVKPTNSQLYLHYHSCQPTSTKHSIPYSLATRGCHICNCPDNFHTYTSNLTRAFTSRGTQSLSSRNNYSMVSTTHPPQNPDHLTLITTYYPGLHSLKRILREGFHILSSDPSTQDLLTKPPSITSQPPPPQHLPTHCRY